VGGHNCKIDAIMKAWGAGAGAEAWVETQRSPGLAACAGRLDNAGAPGIG
jgi:hypothetical protein